ncbi:serine/threonine protein kinase [Streptomyces sp. NBC_01007]|nr:serine/threonine protein kinase [Streptomyces sp. NBC_01007]
MDGLKPQDPAQIGAHTLLARLGAGGMGQVYLGRSPGGRLVAIKVIRDEITDHPDALARFRREVETARAVRSAYTANLIDASLDSTPYWLATEYVAGPTLSKAVVERGLLPVETCRGLFAALAEGLAAVHAHSVTHRDLKPLNVILGTQGPQLIDFGIARGVGQTALTDAGFASGTPGFTAPEVLMRNEVGPAADVFALGATIAYAATGRAPFGVGDAAAVSYRAVHEPIDLTGVEPELSALIEECVAKEPDRRPRLDEVIARCGVRSALVEDPFYRGLTASGEAAPQPSPVAMAQQGQQQDQQPGLQQGQQPGLHALPTVGTPYAAGTPNGVHGYSPTQVSQPVSAARRGKAVWATVVGIGLVVGVSTALVATLLSGKGEPGGNEASGAGKNRASASAKAKASEPAKREASPAATSAAPTTPADDTSTAEPTYVEQTNPSRDFWTADANSQDGLGTCGLPPEERNEHFQFSVSQAGSDAPYTSGKGRIGIRLKYADPKPGEHYYLSVVVKPPHEIDSDTGKPFEGGLQSNLSLGYTSRPVDLYQHYRTDPDNNWLDFTYPDDFQNFVNGKKYGDAIPVGNDPGDWTVLFLHVKSPKEYASIACDGFAVK